MTSTRCAERAALDDVVAVLWPNGDATSSRRFRLLPSADHPRLLVPDGPRRAVVTLVAALRDRTSRSARTRTRVLQMGLSTAVDRFGPGGLLEVPTGGIEAALAQLLGEPVTVAVHLGPPRANRKPVLAIARPDGFLLGFAKLGVNSLSDRLVDNESAALRQLAGVRLETVVTPKVIAATSFNGHPLLVQSALPIAGGRPGAAAELTRSQVEVAEAFGTTRIRVSDSDYLAGLRNDARALGEGADSWLQCLDDLEDRAGDLELDFGCWHGDWRAVNCAIRQGQAFVWDWERFATGVPLGFDALHRALTAAATAGADAPTLPRRLHAEAPALLAPFGVRDAAVAAVTELYLVELALRYLADDQSGAGARLGRVDQWLLPHLRERTKRR